MANYVGASQEQYFMQNGKRFFYGLRRTDNGELFMSKVDQLSQDEISDCLFNSIKSLIESKYKGE